jgi:hypothetical protein
VGVGRTWGWLSTAMLTVAEAAGAIDWTVVCRLGCGARLWRRTGPSVGSPGPEFPAVPAGKTAAGQPDQDDRTTAVHKTLEFPICCG